MLGGGFAGAYVARLLGKRGATIVSPQNAMLYTPLLPEAASGTLEPRHVVVPLRQMCPHADLVLGHATAVDLEHAHGRCRHDRRTGHDRLRAARRRARCGQPRVPGARARRVRPRLQGSRRRHRPSQPRAAAARGGVGRRPESELGFVFVGAGYAGVEALAELNDLAHAALRYYPALRDVKQRWVLVDAAPTILADIPRKLGAYAGRKLEQRGVEIHVDETLTSYDGETAVLSGGTTVPARTLVWTAGVKASPLLAELGLPLDERGRVRVDATLRVEGLDDVWSLGDCAAVPNTRTPGETDPPTCQHALRQARQLAKNLTGEPQPYGYRMLGQVATLGRFKGIADVMGVHVSGFLGWFIARSYHLYALPLFSRKARVVADWTTSLFFRRDIAELSSLGHPEGLEP